MTRTGRAGTRLARVSAVLSLLAATAACDRPGLGPESASGGGGGPILVIGATGRQGGAVARELIAGGHAIRAMTRNPDKPASRELARLGAAVVLGDLDDPASLARALDGAYGVFAMQDFWEHGYEAEVRQGEALADAAQEAGVSHFVFSSVADADSGTGIPHFESKYEIEQHIRSLGIPYTILRPVSFMENWEGQRESILSGTIALPFPKEMRYPQIAVRDIGRFAAEAFTHTDDWLSRELDIAGDARTVEKVVETFERVTGRRIVYERVPWTVMEGQVGADLMAMFRWFDSEGYDVDVAALRSEFPFLTDFESYLRESGWGGETD
ncbi:MAG: NmrA/HSCARG family protein [Acidobacteriota bacterium]|nr:NmrA/HSCARG family protein [Acidobacteriota bacterium]